MATNHLRLFSSKWSVTVLRPFWWCVTISHRKPTFQRAWNSQIPQPLSQQTPCFALLLVSPSCFWSPTHFCTIILGQSSYSATIQTIWPTTLGTSKLHTTYSLYHGTLYIMFKHTNVPPNCHNPNHTTNHTWNFKIRQHLHFISSNFVHHAQVHNFSTQPQTPKVLGPSMSLTSSIHQYVLPLPLFTFLPPN